MGFDEGLVWIAYLEPRKVRLNVYPSKGSICAKSDVVVRISSPPVHPWPTGL